MYYLQRIKFLVLTLFISIAAQAQIEGGKVYNFVNIANSGKSMVWVSGDELSITNTNLNDNKQLWYVVKNEDNSYSLRNLDNGKYLRSPNATSNARWKVVETADANCKFECVAAGNGYSLRATNTKDDQHYMHYSEATYGVDRIVCWGSSSVPSQWTINEATTVNEKDLEHLFAVDYKANYQTALGNLFTDNSCLELKDAYKSYSANQMQSNQYYQQLSPTLQKMVLKVLSDNWEEANYDNTNKPSWESAYAKKYRVQLYEPYNEPANASEALGLNEHTNLNNPTGIFANEREVLYVMVEGTIKEGAYLYLASYTGQNRLGAYNQGVELKSGLNIIPSEAVGNNYCINYVVKTFDTAGGKRGYEAKERPLSNYQPLKIHIEGGYINGYYNKVGDDLYAADKNADWDYIEQRATQTTVTILGEYMTLQFPLRDEDTEGNKGMGSYLNDLVDVEDVIDSWDNVMMWERLVLGVLDENTIKSAASTSPYSGKQVFEYTGNEADYPASYGDYYNVHGLAWGCGGGVYMYGAGDHSAYHYNTMGSVIQAIPTNVGSHWGPAHEIGHQHQNLLQIRKEKEVTNNLFANVVLWYFGETTSRVNGTDGSLENVLLNFNKENGHYLTNNIWGMTQMYYKLFLYYHVLGHDTKFYPRLFEMLRQDPTNGMAGTVDGAEAHLKLYKKICMAAGEDLTEFFRAHGFFKPLNGFSVEDYGVSTFYMTQEQIDAAIAEVKRLGYKENVSVLFINDATGETIKSHKGDDKYLAVYDINNETKLPIINAEVGGYASFEESVTDASDLTYVISGKNITISGGGGVGYAIFNQKGEIIAFSDKKSFAISEECAEALMWGEAAVKVINADNSEGPLVKSADEVAVKYSMLGGLIQKVNAELQYVDDVNMKVGYYIDSELTTLRQYLAAAKSVYDNQQTDKYTAVYAKLYDELYEVTHSTYSRVSIMSGGVYRLNSRSNTSSWMSVNGDNKVIGATVNTSDTKQEWVFEDAGTEGVYYIKNANTSRYLMGAAKDQQVNTTDNKSEAKGYKVDLVESGVWVLQGQDGNLQWLNRSGTTVLGWNDGNDHNSQWYITKVSVGADAEKLHELNTLIKNTKGLIDEMAEVTPIQKQTLQITSASSPFYLSTNACHNTLNNASDGQGLLGMLDEDVETYFHSDWYGTVNDVHHLQVDLGSNAMDLSEYVFYYTTRANGANCPTTIEVWGSTDGTNFNDKLYTFTDLPTDGKQTWESPMLSKATKYRSLRFKVTAAEGGNKFFVMSRFGISKCEATVQSMGEAYTAQGLTNEQLVAAYADIHAAMDKIKVGATTVEDLETLYSNLETKYNTLLTIYENAANAAFLAKQAELQTWINTLNGFFGEDECGTVTPVEGTDFTLSTTNSNANYYLTGGPNEPSEGSITNLLKDNVTDYYVSNWSDTQSEHPYLQVRLPEGKELSEFTFTFTSRDGGNAPTPTEIVVSGSNDGTFTPIQTFTKEANGFPEHADGAQSGKAVKWTSPTIKASTAYRYLRFTVTKAYRSSGGSGANSKGIYHFGICKFGLGAPSGYDVTLGADAGGVTEAMLLETHNLIATAEATLTMATREEQLQKAIDRLQAQKTMLEQAQQFAVKYSVVVVGGNGNGGLKYNNVVHKNGSQFDAAQGLAISDVELIELEGYVVDAITMSGTTITITYIPLDKTELIDLITDVETFIENCYDGEVFKYASSLNLTETLLEATEETLAAACDVRDNPVSKGVYETTLADLQEAYARLNTAMAYVALPVQLTFDVNHPITYKIKIKRDGAPVLAYDASSAKVAVTAFELGNKSHGWYFVATTDGKVLIMPYHELNTTLALGTTHFSGGEGKVEGKAIGAEGYAQEWTISNDKVNDENSGWYNITIANNDATWYFSNYGGVDNKMGFYNEANDPGSLFQFEQVSFDKSVAYYTLYNYYHNDAKVNSTITGSTEVGYYPIEEANAYNAAYGVATTLLESTTATDELYVDAYNKLKAANEAANFIINMPLADKYYRLVSVVKGDGSNAVVCANPADNKLYWSTDKSTSDATAIWAITPSATEGKYNMTNLHTGSSINGFIYYDPSPLSTEAGDIEIASLSPTDGQVGIKCDGTMMHAQDGGAIVNWGTGANDGSAWRIVEADMTQVKHTVGITQYEHAGLYLNYPVTIPQGVQAYYLNGSNISIDADGVGTLKLTLIDDEVLPARMAVILYAPHGNQTIDYDFAYTEAQADTYPNLFTGSAYQTYREAEEGHMYYVFGQNYGEVGLYKNGVKFDTLGAEGTTHYKMSANKILFDWHDDLMEQQVTSFRFNMDDQTATDVEDVVLDGDVTIYDLYGRRILKVTTSGLYIIDGAKRYIRVK